MYEIEFSKEAVKHVHPEQLRYLEGVWSRQLDKKNRIRYMVNETTVIVFIISAWGHYDDK